MFDTVIRFFVKGLNNFKIRKKAIKGFALSKRSLKGIYFFAKKAYRTNLELKKLYNKKSITRELFFFKNLAQKYLNQLQIAALKTFYGKKFLFNPFLPPAPKPFLFNK